MGTTNQSTYLTNEDTALTWWKALPPCYRSYCISGDGKLHEPGDFGKIVPRYGIEWSVVATKDSQSYVSVSAWQSKNEDQKTWRIDIIWHKSRQVNAQYVEEMVLTIEKLLIDLGAKRFNPRKDRP